MATHKPFDPSVPAEVQALIEDERRRLEREQKRVDEARRHAWNFASPGGAPRGFDRTTRPQGAAARPALLGGPPPKGRTPGR